MGIDGSHEVRGQDALAPEMGGSCHEVGRIVFGRRALVSGVATKGFYQVLWRCVRRRFQVGYVTILKQRFWTGGILNRLSLRNATCMDGQGEQDRTQTGRPAHRSFLPMRFLILPSRGCCRTLPLYSWNVLRILAMHHVLYRTLLCLNGCTALMLLCLYPVHPCRVMFRLGGAGRG